MWINIWLVWGLVTPVKSGILDTAENVSPSALRLGGDVMSKAYAQKHRAVSFDTVTNTQPPERVSGGFLLKTEKEETWKHNKYAPIATTLAEAQLRDHF